MPGLITRHLRLLNLARQAAQTKGAVWYRDFMRQQNRSGNKLSDFTPGEPQAVIDAARSAAA